MLISLPTQQNWNWNWPDLRRDWDRGLRLNAFAICSTPDWNWPDLRRDWDTSVITLAFHSGISSIGIDLTYEGIETYQSIQEKRQQLKLLELTWLTKGLRPFNSYFHCINISLFIGIDLTYEGIETSFQVASRLPISQLELTWLTKGLRPCLECRYSQLLGVYWNWPDLRRDWDTMAVNRPIFGVPFLLELTWLTKGLRPNTKSCLTASILLIGIDLTYEGIETN